jgi:hypothetical protein
MRYASVSQEVFDSIHVAVLHLLKKEVSDKLFTHRPLSGHEAESDNSNLFFRFSETLNEDEFQELLDSSILRRDSNKEIGKSGITSIDLCADLSEEEKIEKEKDYIAIQQALKHEVYSQTSFFDQLQQQTCIRTIGRFIEGIFEKYDTLSNYFDRNSDNLYLNACINSIEAYRPLEIGKSHASMYVKETQVYMTKVISDEKKLSELMLQSKSLLFLKKQSGESLKYLWKIMKLVVVGLNQPSITTLLPKVQPSGKDDIIKELLYFVKVLVKRLDEGILEDNEEFQDEIIGVFKSFATDRSLTFPNCAIFKEPILKQYSYRLPRKSKANPDRIGLHIPGTLVYYDNIALVSLEDNPIEKTKEEIWNSLYSFRSTFADAYTSDEFTNLKDKNAK